MRQGLPLFCRTSVRGKEALRLLVGDIDFKAGLSHIRPNRHRGLKRQWSERVVPLWPQLREILEPSHRIDPKYAVQLVVTTDGNPVSGIVAAEDKKTVSLITNPESTEVTVIQRDQIEEMVKTSTSMMPKGLLDRFTKDEIFELVAYLESIHSG